ncbi:unnamed protein product, partial [Oppiella nova]
NSKGFTDSTDHFQRLVIGLLTNYIALSVTKGDVKRFNVVLYIVLRLARLLPQLMIFILLTFLLPLMGSGPLWKEVVVSNVRKCETNWWLNMLLIHNLYKSEQMCAIHTWFIALDFQYHIITAFGIILNVTTVLMFAILSSILWYIYELPPALINTGRTYA